jgi:hypothetical protein
MKGLFESLKLANERAIEKEVADAYIDQYLLALDARELYSSGNIRLITSRIQGSGDPGFKWMYAHSLAIVSAMKDPFAERILDHFIFKKDLTPSLLKWKKRRGLYADRFGLDVHQQPDPQPIYRRARRPKRTQRADLVVFQKAGYSLDHPLLCREDRCLWRGYVGRRAHR